MAHEGAPINIINTSNVFTTIVHRRKPLICRLTTIHFLVPAAATLLFVRAHGVGQ
jgi:hypothetical protein